MILIPLQSRSGVHRTANKPDNQRPKGYPSSFEAMRCASPLLLDRWASLTNHRTAVIQSITVASYPAEFVHYDAVANLNVSNPSDCHRFSELKRKLYSALAEGDEGELSIAIPKEVPIRMVPKENRGHGYRNSVFHPPLTAYRL
jgi:hypothetical protein